MCDFGWELEDGSSPADYLTVMYDYKCVIIDLNDILLIEMTWKCILVHYKCLSVHFDHISKIVEVIMKLRKVQVIAFNKKCKSINLFAFNMQLHCRKHYIKVTFKYNFLK